MLIPLAVLSLGAVAAGFAFKEAFIGHNYQHFWKAALFTGKDNHILHEMHEVPGWVVASPSSRWCSDSGFSVHVRPAAPKCPASLPQPTRFSTNSC